ncbi:hypothetical protein SELMODRAFT_405125 [Selaginella moellendorffii]|uniref:Uncharacterized protein n=1 Tax=Selaginella moellendorffii TaxID=88036 RepID=D8QYH1_SELML|nr:hypothetical protein SELMODRAFT_405125 [Selaginella moellendorffii]
MWIVQRALKARLIYIPDKPEDKSAYWSSNSAFKRRAGGVVCITEIQHEEALKVEDLEQRISVQIDYLDTTTPVARFGRTGVNVRFGEASTRSARPDAAQAVVDS